MEKQFLDLDSLPKYHFCDYRYFKPNEKHDTRIFDQDVLILMLDGKLNFTENGNLIELKKGDYYIQKKNILQSATRISDIPKYFFVHFDCNFFDNDKGLNISGKFKPEVVLPLISKLDFLQKSPSGTLIEKTMHFYSILIELKNSATSFSTHDLLAESILKKLVDGYDKKFSLECLSESLFFSKNHIINVFKKRYGTTPLSYVNTIRLNRATNLLQYTNMSLNNISTSCGFGDFSLFYKAFVKENGISPSQWRKNNKN